jgi:SHS2 domain-containing protein
MRDTPFEEIEHTADWALRVRGRTLADLFAAAARGMFSLLADLSRVAPQRRIELDLQSIDTETLLVDWLNELLYRAEEQSLVFTAFDVVGLEIPAPASSTALARLRAVVHGGPAPELQKTIKAATFSGLAIRRDHTGYVSELVFDV